MNFMNTRIYSFHVYNCFLISLSSGDVDLELDLIQKRYSLAVNMSNATNTDTFGYVEYKVVGIDYVISIFLELGQRSFNRL